MNELKRQVTHKLNSIIAIIKQCANKVMLTSGPALSQEVMLAVITHETLCALFEQNGPTEEVVKLVNEFGIAAAELYKTVVETKPEENLTQVKFNQFNLKKPDKPMLN